MPCCLTVLHHGCGHKQLWKTHCNNRCPPDALCPQSDQEILAIICYKWVCEDCHLREFNSEEILRTKRIEAHEKQIVGNSQLTESQKAASLYTFRSKETWVDESHECRRTEQVEEIQWATEFAADYGAAVWSIRHGSPEEARDGRENLLYLKHIMQWDITIKHDASKTNFQKGAIKHKPADTEPALESPGAGKTMIRAGCEQFPMPQKAGPQAASAASQRIPRQHSAPDRQ